MNVDEPTPPASVIAEDLEKECDGFADLVERLRGLLNHNTVESLDALLESKVKLSRRIGFVGDRGSGKTTFLNTLLGAPLLPTGRMAPATACITEVIGRPKESTYLATVTFIGLSDWEEMVTDARLELSSERLKDQNATLPLSAMVLHQQLCSLWENSSLTDGSLLSGFAWERKEAHELLPPAHLDELNKGFISLTANKMDDFKELLRPYTHRAHSYWPLVIKVSVWGPFDLLINNNFSLIDIPGMNDGDESLGTRGTDGLNMCDEVFFLPSLETLNSLKTTAWLEELSLHPSLTYSLCLTKYQSILKCFQEEYGLKDSTPNGVTNMFKKQQQRFLPSQEHRNRLEGTRVFCLENVEANHTDLLKTFEAYLQTQRSAHIQEQRDRYISSFTMALGSIRISLDADSGVIPSLLTELTALPCPQLLNPLDRPRLPSALIQNEHWKSLKVRLRDGYYGALAAYKVILSEPVNKAILDAQHAMANLLNAMAALVANKLPGHAAFAESFSRSLPDVEALINGATLQQRLRTHVAPFCYAHASMVETGTGCVERMMKKLNFWWGSNQEAILDICLLQVPRILNSFIRDATARIHHHLNQTLLSDHSSHKEKILAILAGSNLLHGSSLMTSAACPGSPQQHVVPASYSSALQILIVGHPDILSMPPNIRSSARTDGMGYVYVVRNPSLKGDELVKIGETGRTVEKRIGDFDSGVPESFVPLKVWHLSRRRLFERTMHAIFAKVRVPTGREFFNAPLELILQVGDLLAQDPSFGCILD